MHASPWGWSCPGGRPVHHLHVMTAHVKKLKSKESKEIQQMMEYTYTCFQN